MSDLRQETEAARALRKNLADLFRDDEPLAADMIEGETGIVEAIELAVKQIGEDEAAVEALARYSERLKMRSERYKRRLEATRTAVAVAMDQAGKSKLETPYGTVSRKKNVRTAVVSDETLLPTNYWKAQDPKLDKAQLSADLRAGKQIPGAALSNGSETITIRRG